MDPLTIGLVVLAGAFLLKSGNAGEATQNPQQLANPEAPPNATGFQNFVGNVGGAINHGMAEAAAGTLMLGARLKDSVAPSGRSGVSNAISQRAGDAGAFALYMGTGAAGAAYNVAGQIAGAAAATETGKAVKAQAEETAKRAKQAADAAAEAARQSAAAHDRAGAQLVNMFGWKR